MTNELESLRRIAIILAGGGARRMGGADKALIELGGKRMIDHVIERLSPQVDRILISGKNDYGTGLTAIEDLKEGPRGPAAGLAAALRWIEDQAPYLQGFMTVPVDGPLLPGDLYARLTEEPGCAVACGEAGAHPTFAYWRREPLANAIRIALSENNVALHALAEACGVRRVAFPARTLVNINTPEDLAAAIRIRENDRESLIKFRASTPADAAAVHDIWARSVKATHDFLTLEDFGHISELVRTEYAPKAALLLAEREGRIIGFMGMDGKHIDSLFIDPEAFGMGVGRAFLAEAGKAGAPLTVDVNEQNEGAVAFYKRMGFELTGRSETDDAGRPYPLLHLRKQN